MPSSSDIAALAAALHERVAEPLLIELTNPRAPGAAEVAEERLLVACEDAIARLEVEAGVAYRATSAVHVMLAAELALAALYERAGAREAAARHREAARPGLAGLAARAALAPRVRQREPPFDFSDSRWRGYRTGR